MTIDRLLAALLGRCEIDHFSILIVDKSLLLFKRDAKKLFKRDAKKRECDKKSSKARELQQDNSKKAAFCSDFRREPAQPSLGYYIFRYVPLGGRIAAHSF